MKKRFLLILFSIVLVIILFSQTILAAHLSGEEQKNQILEWNKKLIEFSRIYKNGGNLDSQQLDEALSISLQRKNELLFLLEENLTLFNKMLLTRGFLTPLLENLPENIKMNLESLVTKEGIIEVSHIDNFEEEKSRFVFSLTVGELIFDVFMDKNILLDFLTGDLVRVTGYLLDDKIFVEELEILEQPEGGGAGELSKKVAVILVGFSDKRLGNTFPINYERYGFTYKFTREEMEEQVNLISNYYKEASYGQLDLDVQYFGPYDLNFNSNCDIKRIASAARNAARPGGGFNKYVYVFNSNSCNFGGYAFIGGSASWVVFSENFAFTAIHELGHNFGLYHANFLDCGDRTIKTDLRSCESFEYGDFFDVMGSGFAHLNILHKLKLGWVSNNDIQEVTESGIYTLAPYEIITNDLQSLKIKRPNRKPFYLEYRTPTGFDDIRDIRKMKGPIFHISHATRIGFGGGGGDTDLLDMTPTVDARSLSSPDLQLYSIYYDPISDLQISVSKADDEGSEVEVLYNPPPPETSCISLNEKNNPESSLDITFIGDGITTSGIREAAELFSEEISNRAPFNQFSEKININYIAVTGGILDLGCGNSEYQTCNSAKVFEITSQCPTDEIILISNKINGAITKANLIGQYGQYAFVKTPIFDQTFLNAVFKELGKSMGFLADENTYDGFFPNDESERMKKQLAFFNFPNCEIRPECDSNGLNCQCNKWSALTGNCFKGCLFEDWYREADYDLMKSSSAQTFGPVDEYALEKAINRHINYKRDPVSFELTENVENFIVQKFLEKNSEPLVTHVPGIKYKKRLAEPNREDIKLEWRELFSLALFCFETDFECSNVRVQDKNPPKVEIYIEDLKVDHESTDSNIPTEPETIYLTLTMKAEITGRASYAGEGSIGCDLIGKLECDDGFFDIPWSTTINPITIFSKIKYETGNSGELITIPTILKITRPRNLDIKYIEINHPEDAPDDFKNRVLELLFEGEGVTSFDFTTENCEEGQKCISRYLYESLDEIGSLFRFALDMSSTGHYEEPRLGRPLGLIYDFYLNENSPLAGVEVLNNKIRLSGMSSLGAPVTSRKASCIQDFDFDLEPSGLNGFNRELNVNPIKHGAIKISKTFTDWHNWHLWFEGEYCAEKTIPISRENSARYLDPEIFRYDYISQIEYSLIPKRPPNINYAPIGGELAGTIQDQVYADGEYELEISITLRNRGTGRLDIALINREDSIIIPLVLEEPDLAVALDDGYSPAQSFFRSSIEDIQITNKNTDCIGGTGISKTFCNSFYEGQIDLEAIELDIKHVIASHYSRGFSQSPAFPVRDIALSFGKSGLLFFDPGIDLNLGDYISKTDAITIDENTNNHITYDFELFPKCSEEENCGEASKAKITLVQEIFYKENIDCITIPNSQQFSNGCRCIKQPTAESQACIDALIAMESPLDFYFKINYESQDHVANNFNLISWTPRKQNPGSTNTVYLTESIDTFNKLNNYEIEAIQEGTNVYRLTFDSTQVITFRAETPKGVTQRTLGQCTASVIIDVSNENGMFDYTIQPVLIKIEERLRDGSNRAATNDVYSICPRVDYEEEYNALILPDDIPYSS